jgi:hypothetical protein
LRQGLLLQQLRQLHLLLRWLLLAHPSKLHHDHAAALLVNHLQPWLLLLLLLL